MKNLQITAKIAAIFIAAILFVRCTEDTATPITNYSISGTVTYPELNGSVSPANGAVVYLKYDATAATATFDAVTVADASGKYSFDEIADGSYFVFANYDTDNTNNGRMAGAVFGGEGGVISVTGAEAVADIALASVGQADAVAVNTYEGGTWSQDWNHSVVGFEFPYDESNAPYTGRFKSKELYVDFDPFSLGTSKIEASIDLLSINTDSPGGRDPLYNSDGSLWQDVDLAYKLGCIARTFGITLPTDATRNATFASTTIVEYGDGYLATGPMVFNGITKDVSMFFKYVPGFVGENRAGDPTQFSSFHGTFDFAALNDFGIESGHVGGVDVTVEASFQITKAL